MRRRLIVGAGVVAAYVAVALMASGPTRPLFDVGPPLQPYQWVKPPPLYASGNVVPKPSTHTVELSASGSDAQSVATSDGQAGLVLKEGAFPAHAGDKEVVVRFEPLDPATIGPPRSGMRYDGNAYRITATYKSSKAELALANTATVILRFPILATDIIRRDGNAWTSLKATPVGASLQIFADTTSLGTFVADSPPLENNGPKKSFPTALVISIAAAVVAVVAGLVARLRARNRRARSRGKPPPKRPPQRPARRGR